MDENTVYRAVRWSNFNQLLVAGLVLALALTVGALSTFPYIASRLQESETLSQAKLEAIDPGMLPRYYVSVTGDDTMDTGYYYEEKLFGVIPSPDKHYGAMLINDKFLIVEIEGDIDETRKTFEGDLVTISSEIQREVIDDIVQSTNNVTASDFLPIMLTDAKRDWIFGTIAMAITLLTAAFFVMRALLRILQPARHPIMQRLAAYGDPSSVIREITNDVRVFGKRAGALSFGKRWLVHNPRNDFTALRYNDLIWAHKYTTVNKSYGITTGKNHKLQMYTRAGVMSEATAKEKEIENWLLEINQQAPWVQIGWTQDLATAWAKDRPNFIQTIDARKTR